MQTNPHAWAVVLAGGEGSRLKSLTTTATGETIPKQYCSLRRRECLLEIALQRAASFAQQDRICTIVAASHWKWWRLPLQDMNASQVIVQPANKGTAIGTALSLLHVEARDPLARVVLLPADHFVTHEDVLAGSLRHVVHAASAAPDKVFLLGAEPESADPELGYIIPGEPIDGVITTVREFVEKPPCGDAHALVDRGALWNTFILAGTVTALLGLLDESHNFVGAMRRALGSEPGLDELARLYHDLPAVDLSRDVLQQSTTRLRLLRAPPCGWTDLGTPKRVAAMIGTRVAANTNEPSPAMYLDLAQAVGAR
jgi:mannose-1-phosphate guanylyltransferase